MRKSTRLIKRFAALFLVVLMSIESFAAVVSDNDGAAFITKAEFEDMKSDFNAQIARYNQSIDKKIDGRIANYLIGLQIATKIELESKLNKFNNYFFTKNFNYFGQETQNGTRIGDQYKYWAVYNGVWGLDRASMMDEVGHYMIGIRGGTGITEITEQTSGSLDSRFCICTKSGYDSTLPHPSYMISTYNYYTMMWMCSNYGAKAYDYWTSSYAFALLGDMDSNTNFGTRFWSYTPALPTVNTYNASVMYSAMPVDTIWSVYDMNCLPGDKMSETDKCNIIYSDDLMKLGNIDGSFNGATSVEHMYWRQGERRTRDDSGTNQLLLRKYKRKYREVYWKDFIIDPISNTAKTKSYYYSGLPLFTSTYNGTVTLELKVTNDGNYGTYVALSEDQFDNSSVGTGGISRVSDNQCTRTNWLFASGSTYTISFRVKKDKTYWIKAAPTQNWTKSSLTTTKIELTTD